ncbi:hypothetical protein [Pseudomonas sp. EA_15y_Pfl2_R67]|uniref:hypothetical protein n=1 Tax=Pseudomonas sp. EA_15y_Pfl2_R67 TaxID=3088687 RepID=UPI0030DC5EFF
MNQQQWNELASDVVNAHAKAIEELKEFQLHLERDKEADLLMQLNEKQMSGATNYTNLILVAGYAGLFGFWSTLSPKLPPGLYALCGLLGLLSLMLFISWEIVKMIWGSIHMSRTNAMIESMRGPKLPQLFLASTRKFQIRSQRVWWVFLIPSLLSGLVAGFLLVGFFCYQLWQAFQ